MSIAADASDAPGRHWTTFAYEASFEHLSVEHGLSQSTVHCILQDRKGFLWFGTDEGLNRYDGFRFQVFHPEKDNPNSLGGDYITCLMEDHRGYLWVATRNRGLTILDPDALVMVPVPTSATPGGLPARTITAFAEDREGNVWIGTETHGLCIVGKSWMMPEKLNIQTFQPSRDPKGAPAAGVKALYIDKQGTLWIGSRERGLGRLIENPGDGTLVFDYFTQDPAHPDSSAPFSIVSIQEDAFGLLWLGTDQGPHTFDPRRGTFQRWPRVEGESIDLTKNLVRSILRDSSGTIWVASDGWGLLKAQPRSRPEDPVRFQRFCHDPKDGRSLSGNGLQCLFEDRSGVLWASAYQRGLNKLVLNPGRTVDREKPAMFQFRNNAAEAFSLSGNTVSTIGEDRFGNLWVGTDGFGLNRVRPPSRPGQPIRFERFREDPLRRPGNLRTDVILTTHMDPQKQLWFGSYNAGLIRMDLPSANAQPKFTHFSNKPGDPSTLSTGFIRCIVDDGAGGFWLGLNGAGLNHFDPKTKKAKRYPWGDGPKLLSSEVIYLMVKDAFGTLWIATPMGLNRFNPATEEFRVYKPAGIHSISEASINTLYLDETGTLWVGTRGGGLDWMSVPPWDGPEPQFTAYGPREGLPGSVIKGILPDGKGNLWLSTNRALCRFNIQEGKAYPFTWQDELRKAEFIWNSCFRSSSGELFFGSNDGLTLFHPEDITPNTIPPPIAITGFQIHNQPLPLESRASQRGPDKSIQEITLHPEDSMITFDFAALHFAAPEKNKYTYIMEGLDRTWNEVENKHSISYATLSPGHYVLRVKGSNCDGAWNLEGLQLRVHVLPPWYKTWWFQSMLFVSSAAAAIFALRWYLSSLRRRNQYLEQAMAEQAQKLHEADALNVLTHLTETATSASEDINHWVSEMAHEVCKAVDATQIDVWEVTENHFLPITETTEIPAYSIQDWLKMDDSDVIPIQGPRGETLAALKVIGKVSAWTPLESQLLASFTHHLGGAYHLKWMRQTLLEARQQKSLDRKVLAAQGQGVLQLCPSCKRCYDEGLETCPEDGMTLTSPRLLPFRLLGRYRLERLLGEGGTAHVFEAWDEQLSRSVAVKAIKPNSSISEQTRERFAREASLLARLDHPGIVAIHDSRELEDGTLFLVMERLQGMTVGGLLRRYGPAKPSQAAFLLRQVASALASTHAKGLVHRDLKPENLFAVAGGEWIRYKVLDFGLAKTDVAESNFTQTGTLMGTPNYMSPEQARGQNVDWRSDIYSLAAILYETLSGIPVVKTRILAEIFVEVISRDPIPLCSRLPDCPPEVEALLHHALTKNPRQRPEELLAWAGRLDMALQVWNREIPGWPDRCEEMDPADTSANARTSEQVPSTLHPGGS